MPIEINPVNTELTPLMIQRLRLFAVEESKNIPEIAEPSNDMIIENYMSYHNLSLIPVTTSDQSIDFDDWNNPSIIETPLSKLITVLESRKNFIKPNIQNETIVMINTSQTIKSHHRHIVLTMTHDEITNFKSFVSTNFKQVIILDEPGIKLNTLEVFGSLEYEPVTSLATALIQNKKSQNELLHFLNICDGIYDELSIDDDFENNFPFTNTQIKQGYNYNEILLALIEYIQQ